MTGPLTDDIRDRRIEGDSPRPRGRHTEYSHPRDQSHEGSAARLLLKDLKADVKAELKHVNVVRLHDVIHTESKLVLIFEVSLQLPVP